MSLVESSYYDDDPDLAAQVGRYTPPPPIKLQRGGIVRLGASIAAATVSAIVLVTVLFVTPSGSDKAAEAVMALTVPAAPGAASEPVVLARAAIMAGEDASAEARERKAARQIALLADLAPPPVVPTSVVDLNTVMARFSSPAQATSALSPEPVPERVSSDIEVRVAAADPVALPQVIPVEAHNEFSEEAAGPVPTPRHKPVQLAALASAPKPVEALASTTNTEESQRLKVEKSEAGFQTAALPEPVSRTEPIVPQELSAPATLQKVSVPAMSQSAGLRPAPFSAITEESANGLLPVTGPDGQTARVYYARPFASNDTRPRISLVVGGLGLSQKATAAAIDNLPGEVTLAFAPYGKNLQMWIDRARAAGHEVLLELPMEPFDYPANDPGPFTLLTKNDPAQNAKRLNWLLAQFTGYVGVTNYLGARFTATPEALLPVLRELDQRGLMVLDDGTSNRSAMPALSRKLQVPYAEVARTIDLRTSRDAIDSNLLDLESLATSKGSAIGMGMAYPVTIDRIVKWARTLEEKGFVLAPVSANMGASKTDNPFDQHASRF